MPAWRHLCFVNNILSPCSGQVNAPAKLFLQTGIQFPKHHIIKAKQLSNTTRLFAACIKGI